LTRKQTLTALGVSLPLVLAIAVVAERLVANGYIVSNEDGIVTLLRIALIAALGVAIVSGFSCFFSVLATVLKGLTGKEKALLHLRASPLRILLWDEVLR
jgi:hypothetical protein